MKRLKHFIVLLLCAFCFITPTHVHAQEKFDISNYLIQIQVNEDGSLNIHEKIDLSYSDYVHGFYRNIPIRYEMDFGKGMKTYYFPVNNIYVNNHPFETESDSEGVQIRIGDPDKYVYGNQSYDITYTIQTRDLELDQDYFYLNLIGNQFDCKIGHVDFEISFPKSIDLSKIEFYGADVETKIVNQTIIGETTEVLKNYESLTTYLELGENYFEFQPIPDFTIIGVIICTLFLALCGFLYFKFGKCEEVIPTVEFSAPEGLSSAGVGYVIDGIVNDSDVLSLIIDFANRGYLNIHDTDDDLVLIKTKEMEYSENGYELAFFHALFKDKNEVSCNDLKENYFGDQIQAEKELIYNHFHLKENRIYSNGSLAVQIIMCIFGGIAGGLLSCFAYYSHIGMMDVAILPFIILWPLLSASLVIWIILSRKKHIYSKVKKITLSFLGILFTAIPLMVTLFFLYERFLVFVFVFIYTFAILYMIATSGKRSKKGNELLGKILGLKEFIEHAEKERLETLVHDDPSYFYHILPYAYVLGISDTWSKKFESINILSPEWYSSNHSQPFTNVYWMSRFNSTMSTLHTLPSSITPSSSGNGGFSSSGGGFSGGGFGGGGGGSW